MFKIIIMANIAKTEVIPDSTASSIFVTDKSGLYDAESNEGGYGAPNYDLNILAIVSFGYRLDHNNERTNLDPAVEGQDIYYNGSAANTEEQSFELKYIQDGYYKVGIFQLRTSPDGINYNGGGSIASGEYYFHTGESKVKKHENGAGVDVDDYYEMIGNGKVLQNFCQKLFMSNLMIKAGMLWKDYKNYYHTRENENAEDAYESFAKLQHHLEGADKEFMSGAISEASVTIKMLINEYL